MADAGQLSFRNAKDARLAIISPNDPGAMVTYAEECRTLKIPFIFDPGQQCSRMSGDELKDGISGAHILICNDYEFELIRQKTGMGEKEVLEQVDMLIVTKGEKGSTVITKSGQTDVPAVEPRRIADPTGVGDAFRGGLMKGFAMGLPADEAAASRRPTASSTWVARTTPTRGPSSRNATGSTSARWPPQSKRTVVTVRLQADGSAGPSDAR
jgi:adenosine kinase